MRFKFKKEYLIPILLGLLAFFIRYYPHVFVIPYIGKEEGGLIMYAQRLVNGDFRFIQNLPHASIAGVAGLHILIKLSLPTCAFIWNPLMGALSTIVFYYILKNVLNVSDPWIGTILFVTLDSHIYRTTIFGSSNEGTGILLLLLFVYTYFKINKIISIGLLALLPWVHIIVFFVGLLFVVVDQIFIKRRNKKRLILFFCVIGVLVILFLTILPYRLAIFDMTARFRMLPLVQLFEVLKIRMVPILLQTLLGTCILSFVAVYYLIQKRDNISFVFLFVIPVVLVSTILSSSHMSPYRTLPYIGILGIMSFCLLKIKRQKFVLILLMSIMLFQVAFFGWRINNHIYDGVTPEEIEMVRWLKEYNPGCRHSNVLWDDIGKQVLLYEMPVNYYSPPNKEGRAEDWETFMKFKEELVNGSLSADPNNYVKNSSDSDFSTKISYVMYSNRFATRALILSRQEYDQLLYGNYEIKDIWANSTFWRIIYDEPWGRIYEKIQ